MMTAAKLIQSAGLSLFHFALNYDETGVIAGSCMKRFPRHMIELTRFSSDERQQICETISNTKMYGEKVPVHICEGKGRQFIPEDDTLSSAPILSHIHALYQDPEVREEMRIRHIRYFSYVFEDRGRGRMDIRVFFMIDSKDRIAYYNIVPEKRFSMNMSSQTAYLSETATRILNGDQIQVA